MAIAIEQDQAVEREQVIRVDIRQIAAAAAFCRKARPGKRGGVAAWYVNVLVHGEYVYGGDPYETTVQAPHVINERALSSRRGYRAYAVGAKTSASFLPIVLIYFAAKIYWIGDWCAIRVCSL